MNNAPSIEELKREAKKHNYAAMYQLALAYLRGERVSHDEKKAYHLLKECCLNQDEEAYATYANCLDEGIGCCPDMNEAFNWYLKAAEAGLKEVYGLVAMRYCDGMGTAVNLTESLKWAQKGACEHDRSCLLLLAEYDENHSQSYLEEVLALSKPGDGYYEEAQENLKKIKK